ncbi:MAG TPA: glycoside hydrolase family 15 protein [Candidatus Paceibacterota bacterium]|nr:glycoside hydrolase family 15 protein [Candidatus Paceibacterota bacterium]
MSRSIALSNGELCVALDNHGLVRDLYYPHVGYEDHVRGHYIHRIGVWIDGTMSWLSDDTQWQISIACEEEALASSIVARHPRLKVELAFKDVIYNEKPVFIRRVTITNDSDRTRDIKLYFGHQFEIYKAHGGDTAFFDPASHSIIHYKGHRVFLISARLDNEPFGDYATGRTGFNGQEGTHRDADDGILSQNPIEHGPADSVIGLYGSYTPGQSRTAYYWLVAAPSIADARELNDYVVRKSPEHLVRTTTDYWRAWVNAYEWEFLGLTPEHVALFKRSLLYIRAGVDVGGGIIASVDSDMLQYGYDTYCYVWPRDAAYTAIALDRAGDTNVARRFFEFCRTIISTEGYYLHKFLPDSSFGSSWHPWITDGVPQLPIQEDETALVVYALREHYKQSRDLEFLEMMFGPLVEKSAEFMVTYRDPETHLPLPSYDLWERKRGTSTFTSSAVYGALIAAAELSNILGKDKYEARYRQAASEIREGILTYLWDEKNAMFVNMIDRDKTGTLIYDRTIDISSVYGVFAFGILPPGDPMLSRAWDRAVRELSQGVATGGIARFQNDDYYRIAGPSNGNPWFITTLWYAEYLIAGAKSTADLNRVREIFSWVTRHAQISGVLSEQLHPQTGEQVGASPLTWAHGEYVTTVLKYLDKMKEFGTK